MKKVAILLSLIVSIGAQESHVINSIRDFDEPPFEKKENVKHFPRVPALLKSSLVNSNPEFVSASTDSVNEDSAYVFNILTNDPDANSVTVSVASNPSWLTLTAKAGGDINEVTKYYNGPTIYDGVQATEVTLGSLEGITIDNSGNIFISITNESQIVKVNTSGYISTFAGTAIQGYSGDGGAATSAQVFHTYGLTFDSSGNFYFADGNNYNIRKVDTSGNISTFAGTGTRGYSGDGGAATSAELGFPYDVIFDSSDNMYIADYANHCIRKVDTSGNISTFAGTGTRGYSGDGGAATSAELTSPSFMDIDDSNNLYFADGGDNVVRKIDSDGIITTVAGTGTQGYSGDGGAATSAELDKPWSVAVDASGNLYISEFTGNRIRKVDTSGNISTFAGTGTSGYSGDGGAATSAQLYAPTDIMFYNNSLYIAEWYNKTVRKIDSDGIITTVLGEIYNGDNISASTARINLPRNMAMDKNDNLYIAEQTSNRIRKIDSNGIITTVAGTGEAGYSGDGGAATSAKINAPRGVAVDNAGNIYISDRSNNRIRKVDADGIITTYAGNGESGYSGDDGAATSAKINFPYSLATDSNGNLYISDVSNHIIRKVDANGIISTVAGTPESSGYSGDGGAATSAQLNNPNGVDLDSDGNIYIADRRNNRVRKVDTNGIISTVAGTGESGYTGDGSAATSATISSPITVRVDKADNIYIAQWINNPAIRKIWKGSGIITTVAGTGVSGYSADDNVATSAVLNGPLGLALDSKGNLFIGEQGNNIIRKVNASYYTLTGTPTNSAVGNHTMTLTASDGQGGSETQSFTLKVINTNDAPVLTSVANVTTNEDTAKSVTLSATDVDGDALTYTGNSNTDKVTISISSTTMTLTPAADWHGTASITAYVSDGTVKDSTAFTLTVTAVNDAPVITAVSNNSTNEETEKSIVLSASDVDGDALTYSASSDTSGVGVSISSDTLKLNPAINYTGTAKITVIVSDNKLTDTTSFTFKVINVNDAPVIAAVSDVTFAEDTTGSLVLSANDIDGDGLTYSAKSSSADVATTISKDTLTLTPATHWNGTTTITAYASDGTLKDSTTFTLTVTPINDAPVITAVANDSTDEETEKSIVLSASDVDDDALTYSASSDTSAVAVTVSTNTLKLTPALNYTGTSVITVIVSDNALADTSKFDFKVINVNDAPVITAVSNDTTSEDSDGKALKLSASDIEGDALTYSAVSDTTGLTVTISNDTLRLKPVADYFGTSSVKAFVSDGQLKDSIAFSFTVLNVQDAPYAFDWVSTALDTIDISQSNLADTYELKWSESKDVDGETIDYLLYVKIGVLEPDEIYDTISTSIPITYQEFLENVFEPFPMLPRVTVQFSMEATDGIDTVKITGDNRVLFVNRYEYLSTVSEGIPTEFALHENYPNPFNPTTTLRFDLPEVSNITLTIYNMLGQKVKTFNMQSTPAGYHSITWDATNDLNQQVGAGVYLYQLQTKDFVKTRKMVLLK